MEHRNSTTKAAFSLMVIILVSKTMGFFREILLGSTYGATYITDAYLISIVIPTILFVSIAGAIATTFIPIYTQIKVEKGKSESIEFTNKILNLILGISIAFSLIGLIFTRPIVSLIAMGFDGETLDLAVNFTRITLPMVIFIGISHIFRGFLQSNNQFIAAELIGIPNNIIIISVLAFSSFFGVYGLLYGTLLGAVFQVIIQYPFMKGKGYKYKLIMDLKDPYVVKASTLVVPVLMGIAVQQINTLIDRMLASGLVEGSISSLNFANRLNGFVFGLFSVSIATVIFPVLSIFSAEKNQIKFKETFVSAINVITLLILPIMAGSMVLRVPIVSVLFERGQFDPRATYMTASALLYYSFGMVFFGYRDILNRVFYSLQDTKTPMINGAITVGINIVLNIILVRYMQHRGLALATSISAALTTVLLFYSLRKKLKVIGGRKILSVFLKSSLGTIVMGTVIYYLYAFIQNNMALTNTMSRAVSLAVTIGAGALVYAVIMHILKVEEINWFIQLAKSRGRRSVQ